MTFLKRITARLAATETAAPAKHKFSPAFIKELVEKAVHNAESVWEVAILEQMSEENLATQADYVFSAFEPERARARFDKKFADELKAFMALNAREQFLIFKSGFKGL